MWQERDVAMMTCGCAASAKPIKCRVGGFTAVGPKNDKYYCGCHGWD